MDPTTPKKVLITGGCGFIGVNLVGFLVGKGISELRILDNLNAGKVQYLESVLASYGQVTRNSKHDSEIVYLVDSANHKEKTKIELVIGDIRDKETCVEATAGIDSVVHLAAHAGVIPSVENPFFDFEVNILGTLNLLNASVKNKVDRFIFASSNAPLGDQIPPLSEKKVPNPLSPYGASKLAGEAYCSAFHGSYGLKTVILRFSNVYGPYSLHKNSVIAKFIKDGILRRRLTIYGDGSQTRDFVHVEDLSNAIRLILNGPLVPQASCLSPNSIWGNTFHLGTGKETSIIDLAKYTRKLFQNNVELVFEPERKGGIKRNYSDIRKARKMLGFRPRVNLRGGLRVLHEWFLEQGIENIKKSQVLSGSE
jgi:UDP-glucose 4-epimerase